MQILRYLLLFLIFIFSFFIGKYMSKQYIDRLAELEEIKKALNIFKSKIKFTYEPIPEIFKEISNNFSEHIEEIFKNSVIKMKNNSASIAWCESIEESNTSMNKEDKEVLKGLSKLLGKTDINGQISEIKLVSNFLDTQIQIAQKEKEKNEKMYKTLRHDNWTCYCYCISLELKERRV